MGKESTPKQKPTINIAHKIFEAQLGKNRANTSYFRMFKIGAPIYRKIKYETDITMSINSWESHRYRDAYYKQSQSKKAFHKQLKATVKGFGGDPDFFATNK